MKKKKGQYSVEFIAFFTILSIMFFIWMIVYSDLVEDTFREKNNRAARDIGLSIQKQIILASNSHTGYYSNNLEIPEKIGSLSYEIKNTEYVFYFVTDGQDYTFSIPYTIGELKKGTNILWNFNGVVYINDSKPNVN